MSIFESIRKRLRHRKIWFAFFLLFALISCIAWPYIFGLKPIEKRLLGTWHNKTAGITFTLTKDRGWYKDGQRFGGSWYVVGNKLYTPEDDLTETRKRLVSTLTRRPRLDDSAVLTFEDDNHVSAFIPMNGQTFEWERIEAAEVR